MRAATRQLRRAGGGSDAGAILDAMSGGLTDDDKDLQNYSDFLGEVNGRGGWGRRKGA